MQLKKHTFGISVHYSVHIPLLCKVGSIKINLNSAKLIYDNPFPSVYKLISQSEVLRHILLNCT
jgi:hypothetical protein